MINVSKLIVNLKKMKAKLFFITLLFLIITNISFEKNKTYSFLNKKNEVQIIFSQEQYDAAIYSSNTKDIIDLANMNCQINYLKIFPEISILFIHIGYFIALTGLILNIKIQISDDKIN
jgi:hypothetical protein